MHHQDAYSHLIYIEAIYICLSFPHHQGFTTVNAKTLILAILNRQEATGYEIRKMCIEGPYSYFVDISYGSIYPTLAKLEEEALVSSRVEHHSGKPDRKIYQITQLGQREFIHALAHPPQPDKFKSEFLLIAMCAELGTKESVKIAIDERIAHIEEELEMIRTHQSECSHPGTCWVIEYGEHCMSNDLVFLKKKREELLDIAGRHDDDFRTAAE